MNDKSQGVSIYSKAARVADRKAILIVEDEKLVAWDIEQTLRDHDFRHIMATTSVRGARQHIQSAASQISLVILDLKLEDGDATMLIDEFTDHSIAVLVVTGYGCFAHAHVPVLHKPFATNTLLQAVHSLLARRCERVVGSRCAA